MSDLTEALEHMEATYFGHSDDGALVSAAARLVADGKVLPVDDIDIEAAAQAVRGVVGDDLVDDEYCRVIAQAALHAALRPIR